MANADPAALVAALPNPALVVDDEGMIVVSNALADALAGGPLGGRSVDILLPEPLRGRHVRERRAFAQSEDVREMGRGRDLPFVALDGTEIPTEIGLSRIVTDAGPMTLAIVVDARERLARLAALETRARTDALTGLANRATADDELARRLRARARFCLLAIDLDGLRDANTRFGHAGGDEIIRAFAHRLRSILREEDLVARTGGDEFVVAVGAPLADAIRVGAGSPGPGPLPSRSGERPSRSRRRSASPSARPAIPRRCWPRGPIGRSSPPRRPAAAPSLSSTSPTARPGSSPRPRRMASRTSSPPACKAGDRTRSLARRSAPA